MIRQGLGPLSSLNQTRHLGAQARELGVQFVFRNRSDGLIGQWIQGGLRRRFSGRLKGPRRTRV
jgi:hypothetical protein